MRGKAYLMNKRRKKERRNCFISVTERGEVSNIDCSSSVLIDKEKE